MTLFTAPNEFHEFTLSNQHPNFFPVLIGITAGRFYCHLAGADGGQYRSEFIHSTGG